MDKKDKNSEVEIYSLEEYRKSLKKDSKQEAVEFLDDIHDIKDEQLLECLMSSTDDLITDLIGRLNNTQINENISNDYLLLELYDRYKALEYLLHLANEKFEK